MSMILLLKYLSEQLYQVITLNINLNKRNNPKLGRLSFEFVNEVAEPAGLEPVTSAVTGQRSNQLSYDSKYKFWWREQDSNL